MGQGRGRGEFGSTSIARGGTATTSPSHASATGPLAILGGYQGAIHADAYPGYDVLFLPEGATEVACLAHTRRKFVEAEKTEPKLAKEAVERIGAIYGIEREAKERKLDDDARRELRQKHSVVLVNELFAWMAKTQAEVLPKGPMGRALAYALKLETALRRFLDDGRLEVDNNAAERALRAVAVGRKKLALLSNRGWRRDSRRHAEPRHDRQGSGHRPVHLPA